MIVRTSPRHLSKSERNAFIAAAVALKSAQATLADGTTVGRYDQHVALHLGVTGRLDSGVPLITLDGGHGAPGFLPWHREYLLRIERDLQEVSGNSDLAIPYWDWTDQDTTFDIIFQDDFLGSYSTGTEVEVKTANFSENDAWTLDQRIRIRSPIDLVFDPTATVPEFGNYLTRNFRAKSTLPRAATVEFVLGQPDFDSFREAVEAGIAPHRRTHNYMHGWVGGVMASHASPYDPIFMLNHGYIDRLWALWQALGHQGEANYTTDPNPGRGHGIGDAMWPWDGTETVTTVDRLESVLPEFSPADVRTPRDVLNSRALERSYVHWSRVREILDKAIESWSDARAGTVPRLKPIHGGQFEWSTREALLSARGRGKLLIEPSKIGIDQGYQTNLVKALRAGFPAENVRRMPAGSPFMSLVEIAEIAHWIDMGCPGDDGAVVAVATPVGM
ncbi:MAG: tyrosinase family protein [Roseobacter sp.]